MEVIKTKIEDAKFALANLILEVKSVIMNRDTIV